MPRKGTKVRRWPQLRGLHGNDWERAYQRLIRAERVAAGLTVRGKVRRLRRWPQVHGTGKKNRDKFYEQQHRNRLYAQGLTSRSTPRKYKLVRNRRVEFAYRQLRETVNIPILTDWEQFLGRGSRERIRQELCE